MREVNGSRISNSLVLHITKNLSDPISFWHYASFFKWGSSSSLISLWKALTLSIDCMQFYPTTITRKIDWIREDSIFTIKLISFSLIFLTKFTISRTFRHSLAVSTWSENTLDFKRKKKHCFTRNLLVSFYRSSLKMIFRFLVSTLLTSLDTSNKSELHTHLRLSRPFRLSL